MSHRFVISGALTAKANFVFAGPAAGSGYAPPTFRLLAAADIPVAAGDVVGLHSALVVSGIGGISITGDPLTQYLYLPGRSGGQSAAGGTGASDNLVLRSTTNPTKGQTSIGAFAFFDEANQRVGIGNSTPNVQLDVAGSAQQRIRAYSYSPTSAITASRIQLFRARGDSNVPSGVLLNDYLGFIDFAGWDTVGTSNVSASIAARADESFLNPAHYGTHLEFFVTPNGGAVGVEKMRLTASGLLVNGSANPNTTVDVLGDLALRKADVALANGVNDDAAIGARSVVRITGPSAAFTIGGFQRGFDGKLLFIHNTTTQAMTIANEALTSTASNRILTLTGADVVIPAGTSSANFYYDTTQSRWIFQGSWPVSTGGGGDPFSQYLLLAGRTGALNNATISTTTSGVVMGSSAPDQNLVLISSPRPGPAVGQGNLAALGSGHIDIPIDRVVIGSTISGIANNWVGALLFAGQTVTISGVGDFGFLGISTGSTLNFATDSLGIEAVALLSAGLIVTNTGNRTIGPVYGMSDACSILVASSTQVTNFGRAAVIYEPGFTTSGLTASGLCLANTGVSIGGAVTGNWRVNTWTGFNMNAPGGTAGQIDALTALNIADMSARPGIGAKRTLVSPDTGMYMLHGGDVRIGDNIIPTNDLEVARKVRLHDVAEQTGTGYNVVTLLGNGITVSGTGLGGGFTGLDVPGTALFYSNGNLLGTSLFFNFHPTFQNFPSGTPRNIGPVLVFNSAPTYSSDSATISGVTLALASFSHAPTFQRSAGVAQNCVQSVIGLQATGTINAGWTAIAWLGTSVGDPTVAVSGILQTQIAHDIGALSKGTQLIAGVRSAITSGTNKFFLQDTGGAASSLVGKFTKYNNISTAGFGVPTIVAADRKVAVSAAQASVATYTLGAADGTFIVSANVRVTTATTHSFTVTCSYTDEGNTSRVVTMTFRLVATPTTLTTTVVDTNGAVPYNGDMLHIRCKASTSITIATTGTFTTVTYNVDGQIKQIA